MSEQINDQQYVLEIKDLGISFSGLVAAKDVNINIKKGQIYGLISRHGELSI